MSSEHQAGRGKQADMAKFKKVQDQKVVAADNEVRITNKSKIGSYIAYALSLFDDKKFDKIVLKAMGRCIYKAVTTAEVCKRRLNGLHQVTTISSEKLVDRFEPTEEGSDLEAFERVRYIPSMTIELARSADLVDKNVPGYQAPLPNAEIVPREQRVHIDIRSVDNPGASTGAISRRGKGGRSGRGRPARGGGRQRGGHAQRNNYPAMQGMMAPYGTFGGPMMMPGTPGMMMPMQQPANMYDAATLEAMRNAGIVPSVPIPEQQMSQPRRGGRGGARRGGRGRGGQSRGRNGGNRRGNHQGDEYKREQRQPVPEASAFPPMAVFQSPNPSAAASQMMHHNGNANSGMSFSTSGVNGVSISANALGMAPPLAAMGSANGQPGRYQQVLLYGNNTQSSDQPSKMSANNSSWTQPNEKTQPAPVKAPEPQPQAPPQPQPAPQAEEPSPAEPQAIAVSEQPPTTGGSKLSYARILGRS